MKIGCAFLIPITQYGFPPSPEDTIQAIHDAADAGFDGIEMEAVDGVNVEAFEGRVAELGDALETSRLEVCCFTAVVQNLFTLDDGRGSACLAALERIATMAKRVKSRLLGLCPYVPSELRPVKGTELYEGGPAMRLEAPRHYPWGRFWRNAADRLKRAGDIAAANGLTLVVEGRIGDLVGCLDGVAQLVDQAGCTNAGLVYDTAHVHAARDRLDVAWLKYAGRIRHVHVADNDGTAPLHLPMGQGNIDFGSLTGLLMQSDYAGYVCIDYGGVPDVWRAAVEGRAALARLFSENGNAG
ncbi:MAG TPA: sugar phosphate isomerase/epimerase family protein [bacterium]|nr:sugar phosphate isomerase/epimerase family protein [bacterium]